MGTKTHFTLQRDPKKYPYGIVFCGGGAKGAYQIGVWKRLKELELDQSIMGISGASVGAINSLLFVQQDYKIAEDVWYKMRASDFGSPNWEMLRTVYQAINPMRRWAALLNIDSWFKSAGLLTCDTLRDILYNNIIPDKIIHSNMHVYTALTMVSPRFSEQSNGAIDFVPQAEYPSWKNLTFPQIIKTVLASSAYPGVYAPVSINNKLYIDGGFLDNAPAKPLVNAGFQNIIVVHLEYLKNPYERRQREKEEKIRAGIFNTYDAHTKQEAVNFIHIWPSQTLSGTFDINPDLTEYRMISGYYDACQQLAHLYENPT